ncbi:MAG: hypothetical protein EWM50_06175 [Gottschalkiaceae bacterium]|nr:MAG: hypothetical protein EWM50_06175 [Gottschalkiaceae bacterium]
MGKIKKLLKNNKGSIVSDLLIFIFVVLFIILPIFSVVFEQYLLLLKGQAITDAIDVTNLAAYNAMDIDAKSEKIIVAGRNQSEITFTESRIKDIFKPLLALNMNLNNDLTPKENSIAAGTVEIVEVKIYPAGMSFPIICPKGGNITRPSVHSVIKVPLKPALYWNIYKYLTGDTGDGIKDYYIHVDTELPHNNPD